jgi:hypothetical protein
MSDMTSTPTQLSSTSTTTATAMSSPTHSFTPAIPGSTLSGVPKLTEGNWTTWSMRMEGVLFNLGLMDVVNGTLKEDSADWAHKNQAARYAIMMTVDDKELLFLRGLNKAKEVWQKLLGVHRTRGIEQRIYLSDKLRDLKLTPGVKMRDHLSQMQDIAHELADIGAPMGDEELAFAMLRSVDDSYAMLVTALSTLDHDKLTSEVVITKLLAEEKRRVVNGVETALISSRSSASYRRNNSSSISNSRKDTRRCYGCNKIGHIQRNCPQRRNDNDNNNRTDDADTILIACIDEVDDTETKTDSPTALITESTSTSSPPMTSVWILDSAASEHMTYHKHCFKTWECINPRPIRLGNKTVIHATRCGDIPIEMTDGGGKRSLLSKVLYCEHMRYNL